MNLHSQKGKKGYLKMKKRSMFLLPLLCLVLSAFLPMQKVYATSTQSDAIGELPYLKEHEKTDANVKVSARLWELFFGAPQEQENLLLIPGGEVFGTKIKQSYVSVSDCANVGSLKNGDVIFLLNGKRINDLSDITDATAGYQEKSISAEIIREGKHLSIVLPYDHSTGIGVTLRDSVAGIGTVTFIDPESGAFGGLGHGICDTETGIPIDIESGSVTGVILGGIKRGESGKPGELAGVLTDKCTGSIYANTNEGVFGTLNSFKEKTPIPVANKSEVKNGAVTIICTVKNGKTAEYKAEIFDLNYTASGTKCFKVKVTDPALLAMTGGIVRGMSGSPIIQNGKLVGAVTHVMVADPTTGYGIFIENMLDAAQSQVMPKVA